MKRLIVNADDLGLHAGINAGIFRAHREGIVTSASLSPNGVAFEAAIRELRSCPALSATRASASVMDRAPAIWGWSTSLSGCSKIQRRQPLESQLLARRMGVTRRNLKMVTP